MLKHLEDFKGEMTEESIGATVYSFWEYFYIKSLFQFEMHDKEFWSGQNRLLITTNYGFGAFHENFIHNMSIGEASAEKFDVICQDEKY